MDSISKKNEESGCSTIYWRIENFQYERDSKSIVLSRSPVFDIKAIKSQWRIEIHQENYNLGAYIFLKSKSSNVKSVMLSFSTALVTSSGWLTISEMTSHDFSLYDNAWGVGNAITFTELNRRKKFYLPNGSLTISFCVWSSTINMTSHCVMISRLKKRYRLDHEPVKAFSSLEMAYLNQFPPDLQKSLITYKKSSLVNSKPVKIESKNTQTDVGCKSLTELRRIFQEMEFSFVTLRTQKKDFSVHKAVLCGNSPVFTAMFNRDMREKSCHVIDIDDVDQETMEILMKFLHFQPLGDLEYDSAVSLYYAADKYQINSLKEVCVSMISQELTVDNICDVFSVADLHQDQELMKCAQGFFCRNSKLILLSSEWKDFMCHNELAAEILHEFAEKL